ncbi:MAG TPA: hypothetical protein DCQ14_01185, partial [Firmicutes bacterium]|nr:hypothetical protein [Bacillota bacterium]
MHTPLKSDTPPCLSFNGFLLSGYRQQKAQVSSLPKKAKQKQHKMIKAISQKCGNGYSAGLLGKNKTT